MKLGHYLKSNVLALAVAIAALAAFTGPSTGQETQQQNGQTSHETKPVSEADQKKAALAQRDVTTGTATGKVIRVNRKVRSFTIMSGGEAVTFSAKTLTVLPAVGETIDVNYTRNAGGTMEATSVFQSLTCLPADVKDTEIVDGTLTAPNGYDGARVTVGQKLKDLKARCGEKGTLVDASGRGIVFYRLRNCYGTPPPDLAKRVKKQQDELSTASKKGTVIEISCNPSGVPIP
jgi:hypothetical protein